MLKGLGDIGNLMKLQKDLKSMQKKLKSMQSSAKSQDEMVTATVNGEFEVLNISIDENKFKNASYSDVEKACKQAVNNAVSENKRIAAEKMKEMTGGMDIPGMGDLF
ncbi:MAG: YbaB/EbfC family nucleoid-associated protein [Spirochaetes bacterium]|nr:YbaB/EbfC family nucleoid-associated protein [Spirochaetota bacterium]